MKAQQILHFIVLYLKYVIEKSITKLHLCAVSTTSLWKTEMVEPRAMYYNIATLTNYGSKMEAAGKQQKKSHPNLSERLHLSVESYAYGPMSLC